MFARFHVRRTPELHPTPSKGEAMPVRRPLAAIAFAVPLLFLAAGCAPTTEPVVAPTTAAPEPEVEPTTEPTVDEAEFTQPVLCSEALTRAHITEFEASGYVLLGGPEGKYGNEYLDGPTPEEEAGGISCFWGDNSTDITSIIVSVAPLGPSTRAGIVIELEESGLNETATDTTTSFGRFGDDAGIAAIYNVLRNDSWISVISTTGGQDVYNHLVEIADGVASLVYR